MSAKHENNAAATRRPVIYLSIGARKPVYGGIGDLVEDLRSALERISADMPSEREIEVVLEGITIVLRRAEDAR